MSTKSLDVTVTVSSYNQASLVIVALDFLSRSNFLPNMELMVVDDCSTQGFAEVESAVRSLYSKGFGKVSLLRNKRNLGVSAVRNIGLENACGKFVCFHDGDDLWLDNWKVAVSELYDKGLEVLGTGERVLLRGSPVCSHLNTTCVNISSPRTHPSVRFPLNKPMMAATFLVSSSVKTRHRSFLCRPTVLWPDKPPGWEDAAFWTEVCAEKIGSVGSSGINRIRRLGDLETSWHAGANGIGWQLLPIILPNLFTESAIAEAKKQMVKQSIDPDELCKLASLSEEEIPDGPALFDRIF
jgi:glycosyltransferase involved in cell wall biosynthesis